MAQAAVRRNVSKHSGPQPDDVISCRKRGCVASFSRLSAEVWMSELRLLQARLHPAPFVSRDEKPANRLICDQDGVCLWHIGLPFTSDPRGRKFLFTSKDGLKISGYRFLFPHPSEAWPDISWEEELENSDQITSSSTGFCKGCISPSKSCCTLRNWTMHLSRTPWQQHICKG